MTCSSSDKVHNADTFNTSDIGDMDALIQKLEKSVARMGDVHHESLNDTPRKQGTSLDPPLYDCRTLFSMFSGNDRSKRVVDIDQIWFEAQRQQNGQDAKHGPGDSRGAMNNKKLQRIKNHSRHVRKAASSTNVLVNEHVAKQKIIIQRASSHPSLRTTTLQPPPSRAGGRISTGTNFETPVSYHNFIAQEMRKASWDASLRPKSGEQSIGVLKEMYEIR